MTKHTQLHIKTFLFNLLILKLLYTILFLNFCVSSYGFWCVNVCKCISAFMFICCFGLVFLQNFERFQKPSLFYITICTICQCRKKGRTLRLKLTLLVVFTSNKKNIFFHKNSRTVISFCIIFVLFWRFLRYQNICVQVNTRLTISKIIDRI